MQVQYSPMLKRVSTWAWTHLGHSDLLGCLQMYNSSDRVSLTCVYDSYSFFIRLVELGCPTWLSCFNLTSRPWQRFNPSTNSKALMPHMHVVYCGLLRSMILKAMEIWLSLSTRR
ncbi:hypothetical protein AMTRI_Chr07g29180 [Amborella trichopoda]